MSRPGDIVLRMTRRDLVVTLALLLPVLVTVFAMGDRPLWQVLLATTCVAAAWGVLVAGVLVLRGRTQA